MLVESLLDLLTFAAEHHDDRGIVIHPPGDTQQSSKISYANLRVQATSNGMKLRRMEGFTMGSIILLHFNTHRDNIVWFWSVLCSGCIPAMSTPLSNDPNQRNKHLIHLKSLLNDPICLTRDSLAGDLNGTKALQLRTVESLNTLSSDRGCNGVDPSLVSSHSADPGLLMLTSGSTGNSKAVIISHEQAIASVKGKASVKELPPRSPFLNWIGLDHVGSLVEIHLQAMFLCVDQVHVQAADLISSPLEFLTLIDRHRVSRSFAPNFFLARLRRVLEQESTIQSTLDLSCLHYVATGGEANPVETCVAVSELLRKYGAPKRVITPGFGMTETCAGAIYNVNCPEYDSQSGLEFSSLGHCMVGIRMRVTLPSNPQVLAQPNERGNLEVTGPVVFEQYFNDAKSTANAFSADGWFKTGDQALIDSEGNLNLVGRGKEQMIINGVKYSPHEVETSLEEAAIPGVTPSYTVCFSYRLQSSPTEQICVVYLPTYPPENIQARVQAFQLISRVVMLQTSVLPYVLPLDNSRLQKTTLGKLSRAKIRTAFESNSYKPYQETNDSMIKSHRTSNAVAPSTETESLLLQQFEQTLDLPPNELGVTTHVFEMGVTSIDLIKVTRAIERRLNLSTQIPISTMMTHPTIRSLSTALQNISSTTTFSPIVTLQHNSTGTSTSTPLWLIHPGVGEVLVFLPLAKFFPDRPLHALRARGFNPGETYFSSISEAVSTYHNAIKQHQPHGPYALAGYSYGSMLAFEVAKVLEQNGDTVSFLGIFNLPPHIKDRMQQLNWTECLLNLAYFLDLITEAHAHTLSPLLHNSSRSTALSHIISESSPTRMTELSLTPSALENWTNLAFSLQSMARNYEPSGKVKKMDVFYCEPLRAVAANKEVWLEERLRKWGGFVEEEIRFHEVGGSHYTMIGPEHVGGFQKVLRGALSGRGI